MRFCSLKPGSLNLVAAVFLCVAILSVSGKPAEVQAQAVARRRANQVPVGDATEEGWSYPYVALRDPVKNLVRIYGQYSVKVIGNDSFHGEVSQFAGCLMKGGGKEEVVHNVEPIFQLMRWDDNLTETVMHTANYIIDCHDPGKWATHVLVRIQNGHDLGRELEIIEMSGKRLGRLGVCTQPLFTERVWLRDWVDYQFQIGADEVLMHWAKGPHVDDLFSAKRNERLGFNAQLAERSPEITGDKPLVPFVRSGTTWYEYFPSPGASYYGEMFMFSACHYRFRYAYDYTIQFDTDEFWTTSPKMKEKLLPDFLDAHMNKDSASVGFHQLLYAYNCPTKSTGEYSTRYTLRRPGDSQIKPAMRPKYVLNAHVHGLLDSSPEYKAEYGLEAKYQEINTTDAYLKHIRPLEWTGEDGERVVWPCYFGRESDPEGIHLFIQD